MQYHRLLNVIRSMVIFKKITISFLTKHEGHSQSCCCWLGLYENQWGPISPSIPKQFNFADIMVMVHS